MIFVVERVVTVWAAGWRGRALAAPLVIELGYDLVLQAVYVKSLIDIATGRAVRLELRPPRGGSPTGGPPMNAYLGGILLPADVLGSDWFQALAAFVAINTLVYAGLSLAKLIPRRRE